jgi:hypothetical protein
VKAMFIFLPDFIRKSRPCGARLLALGFCLTLSGVSLAKDVPITGILLFAGSDGPAYAQVSGLLINGKTELRSCGTGGIDKNGYKNLVKINLSSVSTLERLPDGSLVAEVNGAAPVCVVPGNFKYDKEGALTPAELAEKSAYAGQVIGGSSASQTALPPFAPGVKLIFGSASDKELAEYLLADRTKSIVFWQKYIAKNPAGAHLTQAKSSLSGLLIQDGNDQLSRYKMSRTSKSPAYDALKNARERADQSLGLLAGDDSAVKLRDDVRVELTALTDKANADLKSFREALSNHSGGYPLLVSAKSLSDQISIVDPKFASGITLATAVSGEVRSMDTAIQNATAQMNSHQYDPAYITIGKYLSFADEEPRLKQIVAADFKYHMDKGSSEESSSNFADAVADFKRADEIIAGDESKAALNKAQAELLATQNKQAADKALAISKERMGEKDAIAAYEVLANLNDAQRLLVRDDMAALQDPYVVAATKEATSLQLTHTPIHGRADEDALRLAYDYLSRAKQLSDNPEIGQKLDLMADTIANYYVGVASKYLAKPKASGVGLGMAYLNEAAQYRPNLDIIGDATTNNREAYRLKSRLSVGVVFRDPNSYRDSAHFAEQLQQAFATGLETSGLPVRVILPESSVNLPGGVTLDPNFQFVGDILQHRPNRSAKKETLQSQYRSGSHEIPNEEWNKADQVYEAAVLDLQKAQGALTSAQTKGNKKLVETADAQVSAAQEVVQQARSKMNSIPKTLTESVVTPYNYTRTTLELTNIVELSFRILDADKNPIGEQFDVLKGDQPKKFIILDEIKADDTQGIKEVDTAPNELQLMTDVEIDARDTIVKAARDKVRELPNKVLAQARSKATSNDLDGAGESYILYLNSTLASTTPERTEAIRFLSNNFNIRNTAGLHADGQ